MLHLQTTPCFVMVVVSLQTQQGIAIELFFDGGPTLNFFSSICRQLRVLSWLLCLYKLSRVAGIIEALAARHRTFFKLIKAPFVLTKQINLSETLGPPTDSSWVSLALSTLSSRFLPDVRCSVIRWVTPAASTVHSKIM